MAIPFFLKNSIDFSISPLHSSIAFLQSLKPTPVISSLGLIKGENKIKTRALDKQHPLIVMVGKTSCELGGSEYYKYVQSNR